MGSGTSSGREQGDRSTNDITPVGAGTSTRPRSFIDVVSIIEGYFLAEKDGNNLPNNLLTLKGRIVISEVGFKGAAASGIASLLLTPLCIGVLERFIPIFGSYKFSLFDEAFALALTISFAIGYGLIVASTGKYYIGNLARRAIRWLMLGLVMAGVVKIILAFVLYNWIYIFILDPERTAHYLMKLYPTVTYATLNKVFIFLMDFKSVLLVSSNFIMITTILMIVVPWVCILVASRKTKKMIAREEMWK